MISQTFLTSKLDHAPFSPSQPVWLNYTDEELINSYKNKHRSDLGTEIHEWASARIKLSARVPSAGEAMKDLQYHIFMKYSRSPEYKDILLKSLNYLPQDAWQTVKLFVNDCIGFQMESEKRVGYSDLFWGTADAIKYSDNLMKVFDLKTGSRPAKAEQLLVYAALYCLMDTINPLKTNFEIRIYQNNDIFIDNPEPSEIKEIMDIVVKKDRVLSKFMEV